MKLISWGIKFDLVLKSSTVFMIPNLCAKKLPTKNQIGFSC